MASLNYNGDVVESTIFELNSIVNEFSSLSDSIKSATNKIVSARGFNEYIGGISSDSFSSYVSECGTIVSDYVKSVRNKQISILSYSEDKDAIKAFISGLSRSEFDSLDLSSLDDYISLDVRAGNLFKGIGSTAATFGLGLVEGVADFFETGADLITLGGSLFASIFTGGYDLLTGSDTTKKMWEDTKAKVSEKKVESIFNSFYENNPIGKSIKENAYLFDGARGIGKGLGYSAGIIGTSILTGGLASGLGIGSAGSVGVGNLALTAGVMGFSNGTEEAWADGASIGKGLLYGAASGAWEGTQWALGAKINQYGGLGDKVASGLFKGAASGVGTRIAMDTVDSAAEGFVQPALSMIYKDYGGDNFFDNYANAFKSAGGWSNVLMQGIMGGIGSAVGEYSGARKLLKSADEGNIQTRELFESSGDVDAQTRMLFATDGDIDLETRRLFDIDAQGDLEMQYRELFESSDDVYEALSRQGATHKTYDGLPVGSRNGKNAFNSNILSDSDLDNFYIKKDGSFIPVSGVDITKYDKMLSYSEINAEIYANRHNLSSSQYARLQKANDLFKSAGVPASINELKLITNYSNGNVTRINSLLAQYGVDEGVRKQLSQDLSTELFLSGVSDSVAYRNKAFNAIIDDYRAAKGDEAWENVSTIFSKMRQDVLLNRTSDTARRQALVEGFFGKNYISESTVKQLVECDGLPSSIKKILASDSMIPKEMVDTLANTAATKVFFDDFALNYSAITSFSKGDYSRAYKLMGLDKTSTFEGYAKLYKIANESCEDFSSTVYYSLYDKLMHDYNLSSRDASTRACNLFNSVLYESGYNDRYLSLGGSNSRRSFLLNYDTSIFEGLTDSKDFSTYGSHYMEKYRSGSGYDLDALTRDFQAFAGQSCNSSGESLKAQKFFFESYLNAASDPNNQNKGEVYKAMAKLLEMRDQGKPLIIGADGIKGSFCYSNTGEINLGLPTIYGNNSETVFHESGHYLFGGVLKEQLPSDYSSLRSSTVKNLQSSYGREQIEILTDNYSEIRKYVNAVTNNSFDRIATQKGYDGTSGFRDELVRKYTNLINSGGDVEAKLKTIVKDTSSRPTSTIEIGNVVDLSDAQACADFHIAMMKTRTSDHIYRTEFADYSTISGMIDSVTQGKVLIGFGHGEDYFNRNLSRKELSSYHELVADYTQLKLNGNNHTIKYLRSIFGDALINQLDATYNSMLK